MLFIDKPVELTDLHNAFELTDLHIGICTAAASSLPALFFFSLHLLLWFVQPSAVLSEPHTPENKTSKQKVIYQELKDNVRSIIDKMAYCQSRDFF